MEIWGFENNLGLLISLIFRLRAVRQNHTMNTARWGRWPCGQDSGAEWSNCLAGPTHFLYMT